MNISHIDTKLTYFIEIHESEELFSFLSFRRLLFFKIIDNSFTWSIISI